MSLSPELIKWRNHIREIALGYGLDFFEVIFEVLDWKQMNVVASYGGFPNRYPHWRFGMEYEQISKSYAYGLTKIYEMVINNDPSYAYLLHSNALMDQKLVMAHVYGHSDFFKNNFYFSHTNRKMIDVMGNHRSKVQRYIDEYGLDKVEAFIDQCLSLENLIDYHSPAIKRQRFHEDEVLGEEKDTKVSVKKMKSKEYMDTFVNPSDFLAAQQKMIEEAKKKEKSFPEHHERDVLLFLINYAPLERWQRDVLTMIRDEAYYFAPQRQTKIMNEGWAAYWHTTMMTQKILDDTEVIDYADHHSGTVAPHPGRVNPYKLGMELFRDIEDRWNKGKFGKEFEDCTDFKEKRVWDKKLGQGRDKIFEVRKLYNDLTFLDAFLNDEFCVQQKMFTYAYNPNNNTYEIVDRDWRKVKAKLLQSLTNCGSPIIEIVDGNYNNRGEMLLKHHFDGATLKMDWAWETLKNLQSLWDRPVYLETMVEGIPKVLSFDGKETHEK